MARPQVRSAIARNPTESPTPDVPAALEVAVDGEDENRIIPRLQIGEDS